MAKLFVYPYMKGSKSVRALREAGFKTIKLEGSRYRGRQRKLVLNWGSSKLPEEVMKSRVVNNHIAVRWAADKLMSFKAMQLAGVSVPRFSESLQEAVEMLKDGEVVVRTVLNGHSGKGIIIASGEEELVEAPLYVQYVKKKKEFRVHVFNGKVIDVQRKARKLDVPDDDVNWKVRNLEGGFIYARGDVEEDERMEEESIKAVQSLGLDFGAVDVIYNEREDKYYVLEVNTAPGLTGTTLEKYIGALNALSQL